MNLAKNNKANTPLETNMGPENEPLEKEIPVESWKPPFPASMLIFLGCICLPKIHNR